jgi:hypothetical protein
MCAANRKYLEKILFSQAPYMPIYVFLLRGIVLKELLAFCFRSDLGGIKCRKKEI